MHVLRKFSALLVSIIASSGCSLAVIRIVVVDKQLRMFKAAEQVAVLILFLLHLQAFEQCPIFQDVYFFHSREA